MSRMLAWLKGKFREADETREELTSGVMKVAGMLCFHSDPCPHHRSVAVEINNILTRELPFRSGSYAALTELWKLIDDYRLDGDNAGTVRKINDLVVGVEAGAYHNGFESGRKMSDKPNKAGLDTPLNTVS